MPTTSDLWAPEAEPWVPVQFTHTITSDGDEEQDEVDLLQDDEDSQVPPEEREAVMARFTAVTLD